VSISKNFVVRHGFEVSTDLILADADTRKVGIGTTRPRYDFTVAGGIGATDFYLTGIGTFVNELNVGLGGTVLTVLGLGNSIGIGTALPAYLLDIRSPVSTGQTALYVQGDVRITGDLNVDDISFDDATVQNLTITDTLYVGGESGISTFVGFSTFRDYVSIQGGLTVTGIATLSNYVDINNSVDISSALNVGSATTLGGYVDINNSVDILNNLNVGSATTLGGYVDINNSVDISSALNVGSATTLGGYVDINNSVDISSNLNVSGITTLATVDINAGDIEVSNVDTTNLNVTGIATIATISVVGAALSNLIVSGIATLGIVDINGGDIEVSNVDTTDLNVTGISTLGTVRVSSGIITATSGIVTYYGDGTHLNLTNNPSTGIGIRTESGVVGFGVTFIDFRGAGVSTTLFDSNVGIVTIFLEGGGSGTIGIGTEFPSIRKHGDLFYSAVYGRTFVYYDESIIGVGTDSFWVDAAPFNVGIITSLSNVSFAPGSVVDPSMYFIGDSQTGFFSPALGQFTVVSSGSSILNVNASGIRVTGIVTSTSVFTGNVVSSGIVTAQDFDSLSDINYKTNIKTAENALEIVDSLRGVSFDWKETGKSSYGVIAQELEKVLPELVHGENPKTVNYNGIIGVLIEAIKDLKKEVEELKR
jgi:hypothetical protein